MSSRKTGRRGTLGDLGDLPPADTGLDGRGSPCGPDILHNYSLALRLHHADNISTRVELPENVRARKGGRSWRFFRA